MAALASSLGGSAILAGQSAGGLSSIIGAAGSSDVIGVLGLDATDGGFNDNSSYASSLTVPVVGLAGEPSSCNSNNNGVSLYQTAPNSITIRVTEADHCDFESPTDGLCTSFCDGTNSQFSNAEIQQSILGLTTAALMWISTQNSDATDWLIPGGSMYDSMIASGQIQGL